LEVQAMDIWLKIAVWTLFMFVISSGWAYLMLELAFSSEMDGGPTAFGVLYIAIYSFLSTPISTIWIIGILIIVCKEVVRLEKELKKNLGKQESSSLRTP
jgi:hypothetical protein